MSPPTTIESTFNTGEPATIDNPAQFIAPPQMPPTATFQSNQADSGYISNPFLNTVRGLILILKNNPVPALLASFVGLVLYLVVYGGFLIIILASLKSNHGLVAIGGIVSFILFFLIIYITTGAFYDIAGASARDEIVTTKAAFGKAFRKFLPMLGLGIIYGLMCLIGLILLIVPGVILFARGSLSFLVLFEENLGPIQALKRSFALTKGHVNEMLGAVFAASLMSGGYLLLGASMTAPFVGRYHDLKNLQDSGGAKPKVHWLNYLGYVFGILSILGIVLLIVFVSVPASQNSAASSQKSSWLSQNGANLTSGVQNIQKDVTKLNTDQSLSTLATDCQTFGADIKSLQQLPSYPIASTQAKLNSSLATLSSSAADCVSGATQNNQPLLAQSNSELLSGTKSFNTAYATIKQSGS